ncbi:MAG: class I SAM-dependent methyltransferase [Planctomycetia bacterium]|nr:class I SAM-dependent methyltransferase [Planctomycetia bacterium]
MLPLATRQAGAETASARGHWLDIAHHWHQVGAPLRPSAQDVASYTDLIGQWAAVHGAPRALILGVTPELYRLPWPAGSELTAVDHTVAMIEAVWPGPRSAAVHAEWTDLPFTAASFDIVLCDGGWHLLSYPHDQRCLLDELRRIVPPDGLCIMRLFVPPVQPETPAAVLHDLLRGAMPNLNILKLRLGMALQVSRECGVLLADVWQALHQAAPDFVRLADQLGWSLAHLLAVNSYRDCPSRYHFVSVAEVREQFTEQPGGFSFVDCRMPTYALGERCPVVAFRRRA